MGYLRLFIELRREDMGEGCGQARVELQERPGRVDCKVRLGLMNLPAGQAYEAALVCQQGGRYREYPLGAFAANLRGQAGPVFRGSFADEPGALPITGFKAIVMRPQAADVGGRSRIVGYRFDPVLIPERYEEPAKEPVEEPELPTAEMAAEPQKEPEPPVEEAAPESDEVPEVLPEVAWEEAEPEEPEETDTPLDEAEHPEPDMEKLRRMVEEEEPRRFSPLAVYVLRELSQVELFCGDAGRRAFQRYRHLILMQYDKENYLGIPYRFRPSQREELAAEGYTEFYTPHGEAPGYGEFGYWMKRL